MAVVYHTGPTGNPQTEILIEIENLASPSGDNPHRKPCRPSDNAEGVGAGLLLIQIAIGYFFCEHVLVLVLVWVWVLVCALILVLGFFLVLGRRFRAGRLFRREARLLRFCSRQLLGWSRLDVVIGDLSLRLERAQPLVEREPARFGAHFDDHRRCWPLDEADRIILAGEDTHRPVRLQVGVDAHVALLALPDRLRHRAFSLPQLSAPERRGRLRSEAHRSSRPPCRRGIGSSERRAAPAPSSPA